MRKEVQIKCKVNGMNAGVICKVSPSGEIETEKRYILREVSNQSCPLIGIAECKQSECILANGTSYDCFDLDDKRIIVQ